MNRDHVVKLPGLNTSKPHGVNCRRGAQAWKQPRPYALEGSPAEEGSSNI